MPEESLEQLQDLIQNAISEWNLEECVQNAVITAEVTIADGWVCIPSVTVKK